MPIDLFSPNHNLSRRMRDAATRRTMERSGALRILMYGTSGPAVVVLHGSPTDYIFWLAGGNPGVRARTHAEQGFQGSSAYRSACLLGYCVKGGCVSYASHRGEAWPWGHQRRPETRLRDDGRRWRSRPEPPSAAGCRHASVRVPLVAHPVSHHVRQGNVLPLSLYRQRPWERSTGA